jgi:Plavaka transposase
LKKIDALPMQGAAWTWDIITSEGDRRNENGELMPPEQLELWHRDPIECVRELMGNPMFKDKLKYAPEKAYIDPEGNGCRIYDEMWSADWWWDTQVSNVVFRISKEGLTSEILRTNYRSVQQLFQLSSLPTKHNFRTSEEIRVHGRYT